MVEIERLRQSDCDCMQAWCRRIRALKSYELVKRMETEDVPACNAGDAKVAAPPANQFAKLWMLQPRWRPDDREYGRDAIVSQTLVKHASTDHSGGAEKNDLHGVRNRETNAQTSSAARMSLVCGPARPSPPGGAASPGHP
jgi:hypothetical protein